jgi:hypothetical protein
VEKRAIEPSQNQLPNQEGAMKTDAPEKTQKSQTQTETFTESLERRAEDAWNTMKRLWRSARDYMGLRDHRQA